MTFASAVFRRVRQYIVADARKEYTTAALGWGYATRVSVQWLTIDTNGF